MVKARENLTAAYAFLIGVVLAIFLGIFNNSLEEASVMFYMALIVIGAVVGFATNSADKSTQTFLLASITIVIVGSLGSEPLKYISQNNLMVNILRNVLSSLVVLFIPATIIVALKTVFASAKV